MKQALIAMMFLVTLVVPALAVKNNQQYELTVKVVDENHYVWATRDRYYGTDCYFGGSSASCYSGEQSGVFDGWKHMQVEMAVEASDGNVYRIGCTANWKGSKCHKLIVGDTFRARWEEGPEESGLHPGLWQGWREVDVGTACQGYWLRQRRRVRYQFPARPSGEEPGRLQGQLTCRTLTRAG